jgi:excisionase family DNA binding protein
MACLPMFQPMKSMSFAEIAMLTSELQDFAEGLLEEIEELKHADNQFLTTAPAARELNVSAQTVIVWERRGVLPAIKTANGIRLFRRADVERLKRERAEKQRA